MPSILEKGVLTMEQEKLAALLEKRLKDKGKISCKQALEWAEELGIPPKRITEILNEKGIKIYGCQLGCF